MKKTIVILPLIALLAVSFLLQDGVRAATPSDVYRKVIPEASVLLAESGSHGSDEVDKKLHDQSVRANRKKPMEPAIHDAVRKLVNTSHKGLAEEKTDKGVEMKLKGRFRTAPVATIDEKGEITVRDHSEPPVD